MGSHTKESKEMAISDIPISVFTDRTLSPLEAVCEYLKNEKELTYAQIARMLKRDDRTIWTIVNRAKKKRGEQRAGA